MNNLSSELVADWTYAWLSIARAYRQHKYACAKGRYSIGNADCMPKLRYNVASAIDMGIKPGLAARLCGR